jgi:tryptophan synthase alpha chain
MSRLTTRFDELARTERKALIPFITAGDPDPELTVQLMHTMVRAGADIVELGVPFSDPMADGPVIQRASERALEHHVSLRHVLEMVARFRQQDDTTPVVLMGYLNPIECLGYEAFAKAAGNAGVDGTLTVDMPPEEAGVLAPMLENAGVDPIFLLAPNSTDERIQLIGAAGKGYLYYVSLKGVTGASHLDVSSVERKLQQIRRSTDLPIAVGFGVKDAKTAAMIADLADAVVVGSALINIIEKNLERRETIESEISALLNAMRTRMDASIPA